MAKSLGAGLLKIIEEKNEVLKKENIVWVQAQFVDLCGYLRSVSVPAKELYDGDFWFKGENFDGSSVKGFANVDCSDMTLIPDAKTLQVMPYGDGEQKTARVVCDIINPRTGKPFEGDPRAIAKRTMENAENMGYDKTWFSPELEFYVFRNTYEAMLHNDIWTNDHIRGGGIHNVIPNVLPPIGYTMKPKSAYFAAAPIDETESFRNEFSSILHKMGIKVKYHHHEGGCHQQEVEFAAMPSVVDASDASVLYKLLSRLVAKRHGLLVTYMPKPMFADAGSGMHAHIHLWKKGNNVFYDENDKYKLSQTARYFIGGILSHARAMCAITNPTINSYRRLVPGFEAPTYVAWSSMNRTALVRIPAFKGDPLKVNIEPRHADTSANPYLAFAVLLHCGLDGIKKKIEPGEPINENLYKMNAERRKELGIKTLPQTLGEALDEMESDEVIKEALGKHAFESFLELKRTEWSNFCTYVSPWEHHHYFDI
ncbi:MAG: type I glutamate--ammonia ligase [Thermoplasmata archaeon]